MVEIHSNKIPAASYSVPSVLLRLKKLMNLTNLTNEDLQALNFNTKQRILLVLFTEIDKLDSSKDMKDKKIFSNKLNHLVDERKKEKINEKKHSESSLQRSMNEKSYMKLFMSVIRQQLKSLNYESIPSVTQLQSQEIRICLRIFDYLLRIRSNMISDKVDNIDYNRTSATPTKHSASKKLPEWNSSTEIQVLEDDYSNMLAAVSHLETSPISHGEKTPRIAFSPESLAITTKASNQTPLRKKMHDLQNENESLKTKVEELESILRSTTSYDDGRGEKAEFDRSASMFLNDTMSTVAFEPRMTPSQNQCDIRHINLLKCQIHQLERQIALQSSSTTQFYQLTDEFEGMLLRLQEYFNNCEQDSQGQEKVLYTKTKRYVFPVQVDKWLDSQLARLASAKRSANKAALAALQVGDSRFKEVEQAPSPVLPQSDAVWPNILQVVNSGVSLPLPLINSLSSRLCELNQSLQSVQQYLIKQQDPALEECLETIRSVSHDMATLGVYQIPSTEGPGSKSKEWEVDVSQLSQHQFKHCLSKEDVAVLMSKLPNYGNKKKSDQATKLLLQLSKKVSHVESVLKSDLHQVTTQLNQLLQQHPHRHKK